MSPEELQKSIAETLPDLFQCSPGPPRGFSVRAPLVYPDGGIIDVLPRTVRVPTGWPTSGRHWVGCGCSRPMPGGLSSKHASSKTPARLRGG